MNVLVIDNDPKALEMLAAHLREKKPDDQVLTFTDPLLAVKYGYNHPVDRAYAKTVMRGLAGRDVARLLRKVHPNIQIELMDEQEWEPDLP